MQARSVWEKHTWDLIVDNNGLDPDEGNQTVCVACALPIFNTPFTIFNNDAVDNHDDGHGDDSSDGPYRLHEHCANLPPILTPPSHPNSPLTLIKKLVLPDKIYCDNCKDECKGFIYECLDWHCGFVLDVLCAMPTGAFKIRHQSDSHELVPILGEMLLTCGACGLKHDHEEGSRTVVESYYCNICRFWIHWNCALLPNIIRDKEHANDTDQQHILCLSYNKYPHEIWDDRKCQICLKGWNSGRGNYFCTRCEYIAHIKCATSNPANFTSVLRKDVGGLPHFPMADEHQSLVTSVVDFTEKEPCKSGETKMFGGIHDHPLMFVDGYSYSPNQHHHFCNGCIEPITPPFYKCLQCSDFFLHPCCANLPKFSNRLHKCRDSHPPPLRISTPSILIPGEAHHDFFSVLFSCNGCCKFSNGFFYFCEVCESKFDVGCSFLPVSFTHEFHIKSHIFTLKKFINYFSTFCDLCFSRASGDIYKCSSCLNFDMDTSCARLPMTVTHKFDRHPLKLITIPSTFSSTNQDETFCEICEEDVDIERCFYGCVECNQLFHVDCIPSIGGDYRKVKFGGTIRVKCHECPLTCYRLLTSYSYTCGVCNKTIQGREDGIGFECTKCGYWLHFECAKKERILRLS